MNNELNDSFGYTNRLKLLREENGITQVQLAEMLGITPVSVSQIESKNKRLTLKLAKQLYDIFHVSLEWLYELTDDRTDVVSVLVDNLNNVFRMNYKEKSISINIELGEFIDKLNEAYQLKEEKDIPDEAFKYWIDGLKKEYNEKLHDINNNRCLLKKYYLQDYDEHINETSTNNNS